jgi:type I restriction enzyme M protein
MNTVSIISKVWSFCHTLRDDGVSYGDYLEQLTYLLFLKMADEYVKIYNKKIGIPEEYKWESVKSRKGYFKKRDSLFNESFQQTPQLAQFAFY